MGKIILKDPKESTLIRLRMLTALLESGGAKVDSTCVVIDPDEQTGCKSDGIRQQLNITFISKESFLFEE